MQAFREGNEREAQRRVGGSEKRGLKKLEKSFEKALTNEEIYDILFELSRKEQRIGP